MEKRKTLLIVDDEIEMREILKDSLDGKFHVILAEGVNEAFNTLERVRTSSHHVTIHAILSDFRMPGIDGLEFLRKIRNSEHHSIAFILMSGALSDHDEKSILNADADGVIPKPFSTSELLEKLNQALQMRESKEVNDLLGE